MPRTFVSKVISSGILSLSILTVWIASALAQSTTRPATSPVELSQTAKDAQYHFSIRYPAGWTRRNDDAPGNINVDSPTTRPEELSADFMAVAYPLSKIPGKIDSLDAYHKHEMQLVQQYQGQVIDERDAQLAGLPAKRSAFTTKYNGGEQFVITVGAIKDGTVFGISFTGTAADAQRYSEEIEAMIQSFRLEP